MTKNESKLLSTNNCAEQVVPCKGQKIAYELKSIQKIFSRLLLCVTLSLKKQIFK